MSLSIVTFVLLYNLTFLVVFSRSTVCINKTQATERLVYINKLKKMLIYDT